MRRLVVTCASLVVLALPAAAAAAAAHPSTPIDGTLVVRGADNGDGVGKTARPVVTLVIDGFAIGQIANGGRIQIYQLGSSDANPEVSGADWHRDVTTTLGDGTTADGTQWGGVAAFRFRAVGTYKLVIYGSGVYVFASGHGRVWFNGQSDPTANDGTYSLSGKDFVPIPFKATLPIGVSSGG